MNFFSEKTPSKTINKKSKMPTNNKCFNEEKNYKALPILNKSLNFKNISFNKEEKNNKNNIMEDKKKEPELLSIYQNKNTNLYYTNSFRSMNSSNISNITQKYNSIQNNNSCINIYIKKKQKSNVIYENTLLKNLKKKKINSINYFTLKKNLSDNNNINIKNNNNNSNIISFDYSIQQQYKTPNSVDNKDIKCNKKIELRKNGNHLQEFNSFYKFYTSFFAPQKVFKQFEYDKRQSMLVNLNKFKYSIIDGLNPKYKRNNRNSKFILISNSENKDRYNKIYEKI